MLAEGILFKRWYLEGEVKREIPKPGRNQVRMEHWFCVGEGKQRLGQNMRGQPWKGEGRVSLSPGEKEVKVRGWENFYIFYRSFYSLRVEIHFLWSREQILQMCLTTEDSVRSPHRPSCVQCCRGRSYSLKWKENMSSLPLNWWLKITYFQKSFIIAWNHWWINRGINGYQNDQIMSYERLENA